METPSDAAAAASEKERERETNGGGAGESSEESDAEDREKGERAARGSEGGDAEERRPSGASPAAAQASIGEKQSPNDFEFLEMLGEGSYSRVMRAVHKATEQEFAVKVVEKALVIREKKQKYVVMERDVLNRCRHPNVVRLFCTFQDHQRLYFVMDVCHQELFRVLEAHGTLSVQCGQFFAAEILDVLKFIHSKQVIHRDLKPENILLSDSGHIKVTDFGTAKIISEGEARSRSFCGTAEYVSPELLENKGACQSSDLWAYGCVLFQFFAGRVPFRGGSEYLTFQMILALEFEFPSHFPKPAHDLVSRLIVLDPLQRLGADPEGNATKYAELRAHPFFAGVSWDNPPLHEQKPPPITKLIPKSEIKKGGAHRETEEEEEEGGAETHDASPVQNRSFAHILRPNEQIAHVTLVTKRKGLFGSKRRILLLSDAPRLLYLHPDTAEVKGEIPWSAQLSVILKSKRDFVVKVPGREYYIEDPNSSADEWADAILAMQTTHLRLQDSGAQ
mmetsp:Transcript_45565/g.108029  ORF Transcript_45565/g.108029 Transcript_45565/m.108029 type:complete len:506 (+) Transcript_45565:113-1630(+)